MMKPRMHIFVCSSSRPNGMQKGFCHSKEGVDILSAFLEERSSRELDSEVFITNTGCFGICEKGPIVVVYPDNVWYGSVTVDDVEEIMDSHVEGGRPVERLML